MNWWPGLLVFIVLGILFLLIGIGELRKRSLDRWLVPYLLQRGRRLRRPHGPIHVLICIADHFEPRMGNVLRRSRSVARREMGRATIPRCSGSFRDSDGRTPRHTFFYPIEEYDAEHLDALAGLCRAGYGEVEIHLHHDNDTAENLRETLAGGPGSLPIPSWPARPRPEDRPARFRLHPRQLGAGQFAARRPMVRRQQRARRPARDGLLRRFHVPLGPQPDPAAQDQQHLLRDRRSPAAPLARPRDRRRDRAGTRRWPDADPGPARAGLARPPLGPVPAHRERLSPGQSAAAHRSPGPLAQGASPGPGRPDWFFVKLHAHGAPESSHEVLLGEPMVRFHQDLADRARRDPDFHYHYVTAREMYNLVKAAEEGWSGTVAEALDYHLVWERRPAGDSDPSAHRWLQTRPEEPSSRSPSRE